MFRELRTFEIHRQTIDGVTAYGLDGGMSAEYAVQEALASLSGGVAHTWNVQEPGLGPNPVRASRAFLRQAVERTIELYDELAPDAVYDTVVMGTGVSSASYVAHALRAPFLPLHFLASADSIAETQNCLDGAVEDGCPAYATLAYDESMPTLAVAWIKMLALPPQYVEFLQRHRVRRVVLIGTRGQSPHLARRPVTGGDMGALQAGQVLVTWPDAGSQLDEVWLRRTIDDLDAVELEPDAFQITDWESGLAEEVITGVIAGLRENGQEPWLLTADDYLAAYDLATYVHAAHLAEAGRTVRRIVLNPYLITHPHAESIDGALPLLYWQLDRIDVTLDRLEHAATAATGLARDELRALPVVVNATLNVGGPAHADALAAALRARGFTDVTTLDTSADEVIGDRADTPFWRALDVVSASDRSAVESSVENVFGMMRDTIQRLPNARFERLDS